MSDRNKLALTLHYAIETLGRIAYAGPSIGSMRDDRYYGNEFIMEINRIRKEAKDFLEDALHTDNPVYTGNYQAAYDLVLNFFNGDEQKTILWFSTPNPLLGEVSPFKMIIEGRSNKLLRIITNLIDENER